MPLNIKNLEVERLAREVAALAHESKTEAIRRALEERCVRLRTRSGAAIGKIGLRNYLEQSVWPLIPADVLGQPLSKKEKEQILGYGPQGY